MRRQASRAFTGWLLVVSLALAGCASRPSLESRTPSHALKDTGSTRLGQAIAPEAARRPGLSGIEAVTDGRVGFGLRVALARAATRSIDIHTFIWKSDETGTLLFEEMLRAAERGVRVRLLLDDVNTKGMDPTFALLDAQPDIELRLYDPFIGRGSRTLGMLGDFERLNRRMHNKSFTVDNQVSIIGGRNVANEYFEAGDDVSFADIDVMVVGSVVPAISTEFDLYWNSASAYPARLIIDRSPALGRAEFAQRAQDAITDARKYADAIARTPQAQALLAGELKFEWTSARVVHDPEKTLSSTAEFVAKNPNTARAMTAAVLEASKYIDVMANRKKVAEIIADKSYVNCPVEVIDQRLEGNYDNGNGRVWKDPDYMKFYDDGTATFPYLSDGMWFLTQHKRWGLLKEDPDYLAVAQKINQVDIYRQAAAATNTPVPKEPMRTSKLIDGVVWDGKNPKAYAAGFKLKAMKDA